MDEATSGPCPLLPPSYDERESKSRTDFEVGGTTDPLMVSGLHIMISNGCLCPCYVRFSTSVEKGYRE